MVEPEYFLRRFSNVGERNDFARLIQNKMLRPLIYSWVVKTDDMLWITHESSDIRTLVFIANRTGICQIFKDGFAAMFQSNDVVKVEFKKGKTLRDEAVLTAVIGTLTTAKRSFGDMYSLMLQVGKP